MRIPLCETAEELKKNQETAAAARPSICLQMLHKHTQFLKKMPWTNGKWIGVSQFRTKKHMLQSVLQIQQVEAAFGSDSNFAKKKHASRLCPILASSSLIRNSTIPRWRSSTTLDFPWQEWKAKRFGKTTITRPYIECKTLTIRKRPLQHSIWRLWGKSQKKTWKVVISNILCQLKWSE